MLVALSKNGAPVSLLDNWTKQQLEALRQRETFICPACRSEVLLKIGEKRLSHFAHKKEAACASSSEAETPYHLQGKTDLWRWIKKQRLHAELEPYLPQIRQRPDLLVFYGNNAYAIEYQCSVISAEMFRKRTAAYIRAGIRPIWVLSAQKLRRVSFHFLKLSAFQWLFARHLSSATIPPVIFFYCPQTKRLYRFSQLIPFTVYSSFSIPHIHRLDDVSFNALLTIKPSALPHEFWRNWFEQKKKWRLTHMVYASKNKRFVCSYFYNHGVPPALFPPEAGLPLKLGYLFETSAFIWQTCMLIAVRNKQKDGMFSFRDVYAPISQLVHMGKIKIRNLPLSPSFHYSAVMKEYLTVLSQLGYIKQINSNTFQLLKAFTLPKTIDEALHNDYDMLKNMEKNNLI